MEVCSLRDGGFVARGFWGGLRVVFWSSWWFG